MKPIKTTLVVTLVLLSILFLFNCQTNKVVPKPNILLICIDDLRPDLQSFGAKHIFSPNIDQLAQNGVSFQNHYVNAPSCGPSRYTLLTGQYGSPQNNALFLRAQEIQKGNKNTDPSMPEWFKNNGYTTVSVGKVSHHPGGRGGKDWNDSTTIEIPKAWDKHLMPIAEWQHPRGMMHGLAYGEIRKNAKDMDIYQSSEGDDMIYPDGAIVNAGLKQLKALSNNTNKPFLLAIGIIKPHLPFGAPKTYYDQYKNIDFPKIAHPRKPKGKTTWHGSGEFMKYNRWGKNPNKDSIFALEIRKHYAACVSYADAQVGKIMHELKRTGQDKNTIVVLWGDHGWHLGEHSIWGKHSLFEESLHSPMIISYPGLQKKGANTKAVVATLDIFPTLCELTGLTPPNFTKGKSLKLILENPTKEGHPAIAYTSKASTIRTKTHRLILHKDGFIELYDHTSPEKETNNIAVSQPELVATLKQELLQKLK